VILLIDFGNSRIKWTTMQSASVAPSRAMSWSHENLDFLFEAHWRPLPRIDGAWVANVAGPKIEQWLRRVLKRRFDVDPKFVRSSAALGGIRNSYEEPTQLGVDRLVAMVAAYQRCRAAVCVVDCGTAVTVDLVDGEGVFRGGVIAPGTSLMRRALARDTHALPVTEITATTVGARTTEAGIAAGCLLAVSGLIARVHSEFTRELGAAPQCVLTGGEAPQILPTLGIPCDHDPDLVLHGLACLAGNET
jgi:type III pantothenate kinase